MVGGYADLLVAEESLLSLRRPQQTMQPARGRRIRETKVNQKPGPVLVVTPDPSLSISCFTSAKSAISIANAIRVNNVAKNESKDARSVTVMWVENAQRNAANVTPVATG